MTGTSTQICVDHSDGLAVVTWDLPDKPVNVWTEDSIAAFSDCMDNLLSDDAITGIVITSAKDVFHVGAELETALELGALPADDLFARIMRMHTLFRRMETAGKPIAAAINGHALGGGFELALACHARIVADTPHLQLGLPEAKIGLMPGFGGTQRLARLMPLADAFPAMAQGRAFSPQRALKAGIITAVAPEDDILDVAKAWVTDNPKAKQPWDSKGFKLPSGEVYSPANMQFFAGSSGQLRKTTHGNYPAPPAILEALYHGLQMPIDQALKVETRKFIEICRSDEARAMIETLFFGMNAANNGDRRPSAPETRTFKTIGIVGAGLMGGGIAYVAAKSGLSVVLLDLDLEAAKRGVAYSEPLLDKALSRGRITAEDKDTHLSRLKATNDYDDLATCDLVIEAVFESKPVKTTVLKAIEAVVSDTALIASNTSTIPISELAASLKAPDRMVGLHFFSPVEKMPLVEIISGEATSETALAAAYDFVMAIGKTPIDVNDGRGFYTTRVVASYMSEGIALLSEGVPAALIENAGKMAGMPMGPIRLIDLTAIDLAVKIDDQNKADLGADYVKPIGGDIPRKMMELGRLGEKSSAGFYDYENGKPTGLWAGLSEHFPVTTHEGFTLKAVQKRLMIRQAIEMLRCMDEGVLKTPEDADLGSILGWGFAPQTGGIAHYIDKYGAAKLTRDAHDLAKSAGARFTPPSLLVRLSKTDSLLFEAAA